MDLLEIIEINDVDSKIIQEKNDAIQEIETEMYHIAEIFADLNNMLSIQGETIDVVGKNINVVENDVAISLKNLADTVEIVDKRNRMIRDLAIVAGGISLGAFGFIAGPFIGLGTLISGAGVGGGIVYANNKLEK